jgi:hypothetical protein
VDSLLFKRKYILLEKTMLDQLSLPESCPACGAGYFSEEKNTPIDDNDKTFSMRRYYKCGVELATAISNYDNVIERDRSVKSGCTSRLRELF